MSFHSKREGYSVNLIGDTFPVRQSLQELGFKWNSGLRVWWIDDRTWPYVNVKVSQLPGYAGMKTASTVADVVRVSHEDIRVLGYLRSVIHTAAKETFEKYVEGKKFPSPKTGKKILFTSLPPEQQKKIHDHWQESEERGSKEDDNFGSEELLSDYNLKIVGGDKKRAAYVAKKVQEGIDKSADICKVEPPVCEGNLGISRDNMPQVMDKSVKALLKSDKPGDKKKGEAAVAAGADPNSDKSILDHLLGGLKKSGVAVKETKLPAGKLKATQREIKAGKSFGMADAYYKGNFDPADEEIIVSSDGHILDGHHRWAAMLLADPDREMKVKQIDMPMREFLRYSLKQPGVFRADLQDNIIDKDAPLDLNEGKAKGKKNPDKTEDKKVDKKGPGKKAMRTVSDVVRVSHENPRVRGYLRSVIHTDLTRRSVQGGETPNVVEDLMGESYGSFMQELKSGASDKKVLALIKSGLDDGVKPDDVAKTKSISIEVSKLRPCQNEIDIKKSLFYPLTDGSTTRKCLGGSNIVLGGNPIITFRGKYVIDGHHRWSQVYAINPSATMKAIDLTMGTTDPMQALKAVQLAIVDKTGTLPSASVQGSDLLKASESVVKSYVQGTVKPGILKLFKAAGRGGTAGEIADKVWQNVNVMQKNAKPIAGAPERGLMPQTDQAEGWGSALTNGEVNWSAPFVNKGPGAQTTGGPSDTNKGKGVEKKAGSMKKASLWGTDNLKPTPIILQVLVQRAIGYLGGDTLLSTRVDPVPQLKRPGELYWAAVAKALGKWISENKSALNVQERHLAGASTLQDILSVFFTGIPQGFPCLAFTQERGWGWGEYDLGIWAHLFVGGTPTVKEVVLYVRRKTQREQKVLMDALLDVAKSLNVEDGAEKKAMHKNADLAPMTDMKAYTESLYKHFMLPYPAIDDSLGVERQDVHGTWELHGDKGFIRFKSQKAGADIKIVILPNGDHVVGGVARGVKIPAAKFKFKPEFPGQHRGTQGIISHYIEDQLPAKVAYYVEGQVYDSLEALLRVYKQDGVETSMSVRKELRGQPRLKGLAGPMFDGRKGDVVQVRYETWETVNSMD